MRLLSRDASIARDHDALKFGLELVHGHNVSLPLCFVSSKLVGTLLVTCLT
jgi:hypothetical protein